MTVQTNIPPDLPDSDKAIIFETLDAHLNAMILCALLNGIYFGIVTITLWDIYTNKSRPIKQALTIIIALLYIITTVDLAFDWSVVRSVFIDHGQSFWTMFLFYTQPDSWISLVTGITSTVATILADITIIWRCWIVCSQQWLTVLLPVAFLICAVVFKMIGVYRGYISPEDVYALGFVLSSSFVLATTLWCTLLIVYRIVTVARAGTGIGAGLRTYRHVIEVIVESSALYSVTLILYLAVYARNDASVAYFDPLAAVARGIAPTLLVGRVAAGHARPDESWKGSVISGTLRFHRTQTRGQNSERDCMSSDLEAQQEGLDDEYDHCPLTESQEDARLDSEGVIHEDRRERNGEDGRHILKGSQADIDVENVIPEAQPDEHFNREKEILGDELETGPDDNPKKILVVPRG
ncbi:uncharacterized protein EV420DRAFT_798892 [Desarmillaria tabescens]|uniref:Uncharacterized protein n=1 Tax=Armillaria tabescens TaxID=1929756 RepID=A0AA39T5G7_ARMTA|nr:uncharacterized protein EV420DRAFT_798892 [Desarmillaria tabescens]KAK0465881.1 hypothetical protein EV420DRAFT_798892 [Desarmillaria tabescens]